MPRYAFGPFSLDPEARLLLRDCEPVPMSGKTLDTLLLLVQNRGRLVDKDELLSRVWSGSVVEETSLTQSISMVRKVLGDDPKNHRYIATIAGKGYQFVASVTEVGNEAVQKTRHPTETRPFWRRDRIILFGSVVLFLAVAAALWFLPRSHATAPAELVERQITFGTCSSTVWSAAISPDGKYLAYSDRVGIHVRLLGTGEERTLPAPLGVSPLALSFVDSWFPDSTQLLIHSESPGAWGSMWTVSLMGQSPRELRKEAKGWSVSPNGSLIAFRPSDHLRELWLVDSHGDNARKILELPLGDRLLRSAQWSPDGQRLAYVRARSKNMTIETSDLHGENRTTVASPTSEHWLTDFVWRFDGRIVYANAGYDEPDGELWQVSVDTRSGKPAGKPEALKHWIGYVVWTLSDSADGKRLTFLKATDRAQTYGAELTARGTRMNSPRRLTTNDGLNFASAWTADGRSLLMKSNRNGKWGLFRQLVTEGSMEPLLTGPQNVNLPRLSPDAAWVLYIETVRSPGHDQDPLHRMMRVPVKGGMPQFVFDMQEGCCVYSCTRAPANLCAIVEVQNGGHEVLTAFDPLKGRGKILRQLEPGASAQISPDGSMCAAAKPGEAETHIQLLSLIGARDRQIVVKNWPNLVGLDWSADGKGLYCGFTSPQGGTLVYVELNGATHILWHSRELGANNADDRGRPWKSGSLPTLKESNMKPRTWLFALLTFGIWYVTLLEPAAAAEPAGPIYEIAFSSLGPINADLFIADADGNHAMPFLPHAGFDGNGSFSRDGQWVVFTSERGGSYDIYRAHPDGSRLERLVDHPAYDDQAALSPDGRSMAFVSTRSGQADIWILELATKKLRNLTNHPAGDFRPSWSPDGQWLAFTSDRDSRKPIIGGFLVQHSTEIYLIRIDGTGLRRVTQTQKFSGSPTWSVDGKRLLF